MSSPPPGAALATNSLPGGTIPVYGEGFAVVYASSRYGVFSQYLARLALSAIARHGAPGTSLLDLACGAGVGTALFARAGYRVSGIDGSPVMVRYAGEHAERCGLTIPLDCQDMRDFTVPAPVDVVTCLFDALNYMVEEADLAAVFARVAAALRPDGLFVFDMNTPHGLATRWGTRDVVSTARTDLIEINRNRYDADRQTNTTTTMVFVRQAEDDTYRLYTEIHRQRGYSTGTLVRLLTASGLAVLSLEGLADKHSGWSHGVQPLVAETGRIIIVARRTEAAIAIQECTGSSLEDAPAAGGGPSLS